MVDEPASRRPPESGAELAQRDEVEQLGALLDLAREIKREVDRVASDDLAGADDLVEAIELVPRRERQRLLLGIFERLPVEVQWSIVERVFGDDEVREHLEAERASRLAELRSSGSRRAVVDAARAAHRLDAREIEPGELLTLGLFRESEVRVAIDAGHRSHACARRVVLRCSEPGRFRVIEDVFNPRGGYFVTAEYDEQTWRAERLPAHGLVRVGSISERSSERSFEPVIYPGGRADFDVDEALLPGRLHIGFVILGDIDVFAH